MKKSLKNKSKFYCPNCGHKTLINRDDIFELDNYGCYTCTETYKIKQLGKSKIDLKGDKLFKSIKSGSKLL